MNRLFLIIFFILSVGNLIGQNADYLIIENPSDFLIYNKYQQKLKTDESKTLGKFTPLQIIKRGEILSDQITSATRCRFGNEVYFVVEDENANFLTINPDSYFEVFENCEVIQDTIQILKDNQITINSRPVLSYASTVLKELKNGELWVRVFRFKNAYFLKSTVTQPQFGWAFLPKGNRWKIYVSAEGNSALIPERIAMRIETRITAVNQQYKRYFLYYNGQYNEQKVIPKWQLETSETSIRGILIGMKSMSQLKLSNELLLQELRNMLLGTSLTLDRTSNGFIIQAQPAG